MHSRQHGGFPDREPDLDRELAELVEAGRFAERATDDKACLDELVRFL
tara:strand:+ start:776 stop:919 length:144 start_codon:yes stop_codon:yes gene_type:complete